MNPLGGPWRASQSSTSPKEIRRLVAWPLLPVTCATCCENWGRHDLPDLHSPLGRDAVGLMDGDRVPLGAGYPVPVRQAPKPAAGLIQQKENKK